jgi:hypothetical protein
VQATLCGMLRLAAAWQLVWFVFVRAEGGACATSLFVRQGQDLASGNLTAPALFALQTELVGSELLELIESEFQEEGSLERAIDLVKIGGGISAARQLARQEADKACASPPPSPSLFPLLLRPDGPRTSLCAGWLAGWPGGLLTNDGPSCGQAVGQAPTHH